MPEVTPKLVDENEATPFADVVALSAVIVIVLFDTAADIEFEPVIIVLVYFFSLSQKFIITRT